MAVLYVSSGHAVQFSILRSKNSPDEQFSKVKKKIDKEKLAELVFNLKHLFQACRKIIGNNKEIIN